MLHRIVKFIILCLAFAGVHGDSEAHKLGRVTELDEDNWRVMLKDEWMVQFYAPWCPACRHLSETWKNFGVSAENYDVNIGKVDVTKSPALSGRFFVTALPTIYHIINGEFRQYQLPRDSDSLVLFVKEKQWKTIEPISYWKKPDSIQMSTLAYFFKLSHYLKDLNTRFHEQYGLPTWGSYALFAFGTVFIGAILGLLLVCLVDFFYPPKNVHRQSFSETKEKVKEGDGIEEIPGDELEDDEDVENSSTSEGEKNSDADEKNSDSESDVPESEKKNIESSPKNEKLQNSNNERVDDDNETSSPEVRKRKPRKAD